MDILNIAISEAEKAYKKGEVPIGAVIVHNGKIIAKAHNSREKKQNALNHAEVLAINKACKKLKSWRLCDCVMYVTLEPCAMCAGAILNSRIEKVVIGCEDKQHGAVVSKYSLLSDGSLNHKTEVELLNNPQCKALITNFFADLRKANKDKHKKSYNK